jgi:hypothetical protein
VQGVNSFVRESRRVVNRAGSEFVVRESRRVVNRQVFKLQDTADAILAGKCDCHMGGTNSSQNTE